MLWLQVGSLALTALIILTILASLPLALAIYAVVLGVRWIGVLHFLGIFIILGIGADDIFVVLDHWKVRRLEPRCSIEFLCALHAALCRARPLEGAPPCSNRVSSPSDASRVVHHAVH